MLLADALSYAKEYHPELVIDVATLTGSASMAIGQHGIVAMGTANIGAREAGAITAGKFLEKFVDYPWIHLDIAGPAFLNTSDHYRTKGGTASGVRLLIDFLNNRV